MDKFFDKLNDGIRNVETSFVNFISAVAPWLAPLVPAYMTFDHAYNTLGFPLWVAIPAAVVVEILGFSAVSTFMAFWFFNRRNKAAGKKAPLGLIIFAFGFYLALIVCSNVLLDTFAGGPWENGAKIAVRALFTLQTIPAALIVVARAGHRDLLTEISKEKQTKVTGNLPNVPESAAETFPKNWRKLRPTLTEDQVRHIAEGSTKDIAFMYKVSERTALNWIGYAQAEKKQ
jgi:hypothetical protein